MNFLSLPHEDVIENHLLKYMDTNRILGFRRVCKATKIIADNYLRHVNTNNRLLPEIEIHANGENGKSFGAFLQLDFPVSRINLKVEQPELLGSDEIQLFLQRHGRYVTKLNINNFHCLVTPEEFSFFNGLPNLASLEIGTLHNCQVEGRIPQVLENLKEALKIDTVINSTEQPTSTDYVSSLFVFAMRSAHCIKLPIHRNPTGEIIFFNYHLLENVTRLLEIQKLLGLFEGLARGNDMALCEYLDLSQYKFELLEGLQITLAMQFITTFQRFCKVASGSHIKLINVDAELIQILPMEDENAEERDYRWLLPCVRSVRNVADSVIFYDQTREQIEEINIESTRACSLPALPANEGDRTLHWTNLKKLSLCVNSRRMEITDMSVQDLYSTLFVGGQEYAQLTQLSFAFTKMDEVEEDDILPNVQTIVGCCANVKQLKIQNWPGSNESLSEFWKLEKLEQVCIQACARLGDDAFIGEDPNQPTFLQLKKLWKLELKSLDQMPNITDGLFYQVIGRMNLTHFVVTAETPVQSVTVDGIQALIAGEFAKSIEKFAFSGWSLNSLVEDGTTMEELGRQFKCNCML